MRINNPYRSPLENQWLRHSPNSIRPCPDRQRWIPNTSQGNCASFPLHKTTTKCPMRSTLLLGVSIIRKISRQRRMFTRRNGCLGSISSTIEFTSSRTLTKSARAKIDADMISFPMRSHSVGCGTSKSGTQSATQSFGVGHSAIFKKNLVDQVALG
jgi:hypothetical protein